MRAVSALNPGFIPLTAGFCFPKFRYQYTVLASLPACSSPVLVISTERVQMSLTGHRAAGRIYYRVAGDTLKGEKEPWPKRLFQTKSLTGWQWVVPKRNHYNGKYSCG